MPQKKKRENGAEGQKRQGELRMGHSQILGHIAVMLYRAFAIHKETAGGKSVIIILVVIMPALSFSEHGVIEPVRQARTTPGTKPTPPRFLRPRPLAS